MAEPIGRDLAKRGLVIVSGLAQGVDAIAHQGATSVGGRAIGVLGTGIDVCYPKENKKLFDKVLVGRWVPAMLRLRAFNALTSPRAYKNTGGSQIRSKACGYSRSVQVSTRQPTRQMAATSFSARQKVCFLKMAWAAGAGNPHDSRPVKLAPNTCSGLSFALIGAHGICKRSGQTKLQQCQYGQARASPCSTFLAHFLDDILSNPPLGALWKSVSLGHPRCLFTIAERFCLCEFRVTEASGCGRTCVSEDCLGVKFRGLVWRLRVVAV